MPKAALVEHGADDHAAEAAVARLRAKLGPLGAGIRTVRRRGYACTLAVRPTARASHRSLTGDGDRAVDPVGDGCVHRGRQRPGSSQPPSQA